MTNKEILELQKRVYAISYSCFPLDSFFNDIGKINNTRFDEDLAYKNLKLIIDKIYDLREKAKKYNEKETPKKVIEFTSEITNSEEAYTFCVCPKCRMLLSNYNYCPNCGQKLGWSVEDE